MQTRALRISPDDEEIDQLTTGTGKTAGQQGPAAFSVSSPVLMAVISAKEREGEEVGDRVRVI